MLSGFRQSRNHKGFSLVEIMVGLAIGMMTTLVIMQVFSTFQSQQRQTSGNADAQTSGGMAIYMIQRELQLGGYGIPVFDTSNPALLCNTVTDGSTGDPMDISPVSIVDGGADPGATDQVIVRYGDAQTGGVNTGSLSFSGTTLTAFNDYFAPFLYATGPGDCPVTIGDCASQHYMMATSSGSCTVTPINNVDTISVSTSGGLGYLGAWNTVSFAVNGGQLERNGVAIGPDVVSIQAQYGISASANSNIVTQWVDASGGTWAAPSTANRNRIKAVRVAVVSRNAQRDVTDVTSACSSLTAASPTGLCAWAGTVDSPAPAISLADDDWQRYRYRVFETIVPLRNVIWSKNTLP